MSDLVFWITLVLAILEVVGRLWPDEKVKGIIGYIVDALKYISDVLNRGKDK